MIRPNKTSDVLAKEFGKKIQLQKFFKLRNNSKT